MLVAGLASVAPVHHAAGASDRPVPSTGLAAPADSAPTRSGRVEGTVRIRTASRYDGRPRELVLHVPPGLVRQTPRRPAPLLIALHGRAQGPDDIRRYSNLERLADAEGFVVAFPEGAGGAWNAGGCCAPATGRGTDDVGFLDEVVDLVRARADVDPRRTAITGGSNGAMMALRYACERPRVISSVAVVAGPYVSACVPTAPTPVLELHGARDDVVPAAGGASTVLRRSTPPIAQSFAPFRAAGAPVSVRVLPGVGHRWMTSAHDGLDASTLIWDWARTHPLPLAPG